MRAGLRSRRGIHWAAAFLASSLLASSLFAGPARASCGADNCALDNSAFGNRGRRLSFELSYQFIDQDRVRIGTSEAAIGQIPGDEDEVRTLSQMVHLKGHWLASRRWALTATLPYIVREHRHISNEETGPVPRQWNYEGIGDIPVLASWSALGSGDEMSPFTLILQAGAKLPTGQRHVENVDGQEPEPHARLGTGSVDGLFGVQGLYTRSAPTLGGRDAPLPLFASAVYTLTSRGTEDYRVGSVFDGSAGVSYPLADHLRVLAQLNTRLRAQDEVAPAASGGGHAHDHGAHAQNTGGALVFVTPGIRVESSPFLAFSGYVQLPLYQRVNGIQIVAPYHLWLGVNYRLP